ncbi:NUDIX domain-containing protein [Halobacterium yunchengense]|uniref:NUDIX domain-containing protein n=1 Tax=Halobacterium yunchengense TaxID=3108497 RepID=UPI00300B426A
MPTDVVTAFVRHGTDVLLLRRSESVGSYPGRWGGVAGHAEGDPEAQARTELREETGFGDADVELVRRGAPFEVDDPDHGTWVVHPFLFDCRRRDAATNWEAAAHEWVPPTEIRRRDTVPDLWRSYDAVRPTVDSVAGDDEHGSAYLSLRALDVLRDEAAVAADEGGDWERVAAVACDLAAAKPGMAVVRNRVNRAMAAADRTPSGVEAAAREVAGEAADADDRAAASAADDLRSRGVAAVFTLSRSGTVDAALRELAPGRVVVAESRPGGEGVGVAEALAGDCDVTLTGDANVPAAVAAADAVLVGADAVFPDGDVVNKVGTRAAALAARDAGVPTVVACAADKVAPERLPVEDGDADALYEGDAPLDVENPVFEAVPGRLVDAVVTEAGVLDAEAVGALAAERREWAAWE